MARIPLLHDDDPETPAEAREALQTAKASRGRVLNLYRALANHPAALRSFTAFGATVYGRDSSLTRKQAELAYTTATVVNNCYYWIPTHTVLGRSAGLTDEQLRHLGDDPLPDSVYEEADAAIVRYAQQSTRSIVIDDDTYNALARHYTAQQIIDICLTVGLSNMVNRFHATFHTDLDETTLAAVAVGDAAAGACALPRPTAPQTGADA